MPKKRPETADKSGKKGGVRKKTSAGASKASVTAGRTERTPKRPPQRKAASKKSKSGRRKKTKGAVSRRRTPARDKRPATKKKLESGLVPIAGVGASAGGLEAFTQLLEALPADTGMAFVLVSHLSHTHKSMLTELLSRATRMPVTEVTHRIQIRPNHVYVIPPNMDLSITNGDILARPIRDRGRPHMAIDHFFRSLAENRKSRAIGVILSGTGTDGTLGLSAIKAEGGIAFAQDEQSAKYPDMPRSAAAKAGAADFVLPPERIAAELTRIAGHPYVAQGRPASRMERTVPRAEDELAQIFGLIQNATGLDFAHYKPTTIKRRISRRMLVHRLEKIGDYLKYLRANPGEVDALYHDLLINVTGFFRDPSCFESLTKTIIPQILKNRRPEAPIRVWIPGCATGEEAYSIAICFLEALGELGQNPPLQIFGTDVSDAAIKKAREGIYPENIAMDVSPERLRRFFVKTDGGYQISKLVRDLCVFAPQNVVKDPPFSRMDLISCRNVLIYLGPALQKRVLATFHYALKPKGFLLLGSSETASFAPDLFHQVDRKTKVYSKLLTAAQPHFDFGGRQPMAERPAYGERRAREGSETSDVGRVADQMVLAKYTPPGVVVNANMDIVQFRGHTSAFLEPAPGEASLNLLKMAREGLLIDLRAAVHQAKKTQSVARKRDLRVRSNGEPRPVNLEVVPLTGFKDPYYLVIFEDASSPWPVAAERSPAGKAKLPSAKREISNLRKQLAATQEDLRSIIEEQEATNEELQSANEEILSANEELQSTNEELETAKEELQATNEELTTVNDELQNRNIELTQANNDLTNLISSIDIIILMLGQDLCIRRFTPSAQTVMNLIPSDMGRPLSDIKSNLRVSDLNELVARVIDKMEIVEQEVQDATGRWYLMKIRPYRTADNKIEGAVMTLVDIDDLKRSAESLRLYKKVFRVGSNPIIIHDLSGRIIDLNDEAERAYGWSRQELLGQSLRKILPPDRYRQTENLWQRCQKAEVLRNVEGMHWTKKGQRLPVRLTLSLLTDEEGRPVVMATIAQHAEPLAAAP